MRNKVSLVYECKSTDLYQLCPCKDHDNRGDPHLRRFEETETKHSLRRKNIPILELLPNCYLVNTTIEGAYRFRQVDMPIGHSCPNRPIF